MAVAPVLLLAWGSASVSACCLTQDAQTEYGHRPVTRYGSPINVPLFETASFLTRFACYILDIKDPEFSDVEDDCYDLLLLETGKAVATISPRAGLCVIQSIHSKWLRARGIVELGIIQARMG